MPDHEDSLGGETLDGGEAEAVDAEQSLGDGETLGGETIIDNGPLTGLLGELVDLSIRYTEEGVLGKGGFGEVILATDTRLERKVAIKRIQGKAARSKTAVRRFLTEAQSIAALNHNNIVQIYDYGRAKDGPFLIMECVQGGSLYDKCKAGPIKLEEAVNIFSQICDGLAKAHAENIIHRDIKPANILMTEDGVPKLTDFGLAKHDSANTGMTMEGAVIGTLDFMPPEQRQAAELTDHRSDLYSLAATFYQMLTGKSPKVINISSLPPKLQSVVAKALEESKEERFQSALEMKEAVHHAATTGLKTTRELGEGECPSCGTLNPPDRKFCRNVECAARLEVDCLKCNTGMPMWEGVCGNCGAKQDSLLKETMEMHQTKHDEAESLLKEFKFDDALQAASVIEHQKDPRLQRFATWREEFLARLESSRTSELSRLEGLLQEALVHEQAFDYESGLQALEQIAPALKLTSITGIIDTPEELNDRLTTKQKRLKELKGIVRERVTKKEIVGLLPFVNALLTLKPDRPDVQQLKLQLVERCLAQTGQSRFVSEASQQSALTNSIGMIFVLVPSGEFEMGKPGCTRGENQAHHVRISRPFHLGMLPVTQQQYQAVMDGNPSSFYGNPHNPVEHLTWLQATEFAERLSAMQDEEMAGYSYRLPTEAEWEYACRAGTTTDYSFGRRLLHSEANFSDNGRQVMAQPTSPVGSFEPNSWGFYDMHGNVWEWCSDWFDDEYYGNSPTDDPGGPSSGTHHVLRGGSASTADYECHSYFRGEASVCDGPIASNYAGDRSRFEDYGDFGIRLVCEFSTTRR